MKFIKISFIVFIGFLVNAYTASASHLMGAQIWYKNIGKYKYEVYADFYRDCRGIKLSAPNYTIRGVSGCTSTKNGTFKLVSITNVTPICAKEGQVCYPLNTQSTGRGYEKHTYMDTIDLSSWAGSGCCQVQIGTGQCCRNGDITTGASNQDFWVWCMIDLCKWYKNSSPVFPAEPLSIISCNQPMYSSIMALDYTDNDSLAYELTDPMSSWTTKTSWSGGRSSKSPFTDYWPSGYDKTKGPNPNANPPIGTYFDPGTGSYIFTPTDCSESTISAVRINEYHKDSATGNYVLVGYTARDWQTWVQTAPNNFNPYVFGPENVYLVDSAESSFVYNTYDKIFIPPPPYSPELYDTVKLRMFDFTPLKSNNARFKLIDPTKNQPSGIFTWKPMGMYNKRPYIAMIEARDNACKQNTFYYKPIKVHVRKKAELAWVEGNVFADINKNCKRDSFENILSNVYISSNNGSSTAFTTDSTGHFEGWLLPGSCTFKTGGQWVTNACTSAVTLTAGKKYSLELGAQSAITATGTIYKDSIRNCQADTPERRLKNHLVYTIPGNYASTTDSKGYYEIKVPAGKYQLLYKPKRAYNFARCPGSPYNVDYTGSTIKNQDFGIFDTTDISELSVSLLTSGAYRRGFNNTAYVIVKNEGNKTVSSHAWISFNKKLKYASSSSYASKTDSTIKFSFSNLKPDAELYFSVVLKADTGTCKLNDTMTSRVWIDTSGMAKDYVKTNNYDKQGINIVAAVDPNIKEEHNTNGYAWRDGNRLNYFVQFQNTGNDTAVNIKIVDSLHYALLPSTFEMNGASHAFDYSLNSNILTVNFSMINLVDTSVSKEQSIGFFDFSIDIDPQINKELKFSNQAYIYFDFAKAVKTNKKYITYTSLVKAGPTDRKAYCGSDTITVDYSSKFTFKTGNKFKLYMSDTLGLFSTGVKLVDSLSTTSSNGKFRFAVPSGTTKSNLYRLKVVSTNPAGPVYEEALSNSFAIVSSIPKPTFENMNSLYCSKDSIKLNIISEYRTFKIYDGSTLLLTTGDRNPKLKLSLGKHKIVVIGISGSCSSISDTLKLANDTLPQAKLSTPSHTNFKVCGNDSVTLEIDGGHSSFELLGNSLAFLQSVNSAKTKVVIPNSNDQRTARVTSSLGCSNNSNTLTFTKISKPTFTFTDSDADNEICLGDSVKFSVTGKTSIKFQLYKNNKTWLTTFRPSITSNDLRNNDLIKVMATDTATGCSDTSAPVKFGVTFFTTGLNCSDTDLVICNNVNITFTMSGASTYKLYKNNNFWTIPSTNPITLFGINNNDEIYAEGTVKACKANSKKLKFKVSTPLISIKIDNACAGDSVRLIFSGGVKYDLYKNSTLWKTINGQTFVSKDFASNDQIFVDGTDAFGCSEYSSTLTINYKTPPSISISNPDTDNTTCQGEQVTLNLSGGVSYDMYKNNIFWKTITTSSTGFTDAKNNDEIYVIGLGSNGCSKTSNKIKLFVKDANFVLTNPDTDNTICQGETASVSFTGGTKYDLHKNGTLLKANATSPYFLSGLNDNDEVYVIGTSVNGCKNTSNKIKFTVYQLPVVSITAPKVSFCSGDSSVLTANSGMKQWQWSFNGGVIGAQQSVKVAKQGWYHIGIISSNSTGSCSNKDSIFITVWPLPAKPLITKTGSVLTSNYTSGNQWYEGVNKIPGANTQNYSPVKTAVYYVEHINANGCLSPLSDPFSFSVAVSKIKLPGLKIYPNPASDFIIIETGTGGKYHISLTDLNGRLIKDETFTGNRFEWQLKPAKGLYYLKVLNEEGESENVAVEFK